jgi:hypothetical protein
MSSTELKGIDTVAKRAAANTATVPPALSPASVGVGRTGPSFVGRRACPASHIEEIVDGSGAGSSGARR